LNLGFVTKHLMVIKIVLVMACIKPKSVPDDVVMKLLS